MLCPPQVRALLFKHEVEAGLTPANQPFYRGPDGKTIHRIFIRLEAAGKAKMVVTAIRVKNKGPNEMRQVGEGGVRGGWVGGEGCVRAGGVGAAGCHGGGQGRGGGL